MALSMSVSAGRHNARHNTDLDYRANLENIDPSLSANNVTLVDEPIGDAYERLFGAAAEAYNAKQREKHPERVIDDYHAKIESAWRADQAKVKAGAKGRGNVPQPCYEYVIQVGNRETWQSVPTDTLTEIYSDAFERVKARTHGAIDWFQAAIHYDEPDGSGHLHMAGIAYGTGNKRGLETQASMNQALRHLGLKRLPDLQNLLMVELELAAHEHGIERDIMHCDREHQDVPEWKQTQRDIADMTERLEAKAEQVAEAEARLECLQGEIRATEPLAVTFGESARTLIEHRGDGSKERGLAEEESSLGSGVAELEQQVRAARGRASELERGNEQLAERLRDVRGGHSRLRERFEGLERRLEGVLAGMRSIPDTLSEWAQNMARRLGMGVYSPDSLSAIREQVVSASKQLDTGVSHGRQMTEQR